MRAGGERGGADAGAGARLGVPGQPRRSVASAVAAVAVGGALGTGLRLLADMSLPQPWGLIVVNALGSAALLVLVLGVWPRTPHAPRWLRDGLGPGLLGAFTTLSGVSLAMVAATPMPHLDAPLVAAAAIAAGMLGTLLRYAAILATGRWRFPVGVLLVNIVGSLLAGVALGALVRGTIEPGVALVIIAGGCGGLTTLSTVVADAVRAWIAERRWSAFLILVANPLLGAAAAWIGLHA